MKPKKKILKPLKILPYWRKRFIIMLEITYDFLKGSFQLSSSILLNLGKKNLSILV